LTPAGRSLWLGPIGLLLVVMSVRLAVAGTTGIVEDEAYYWTWSERLAAGYYDHPPGIAWLIAPFARLFGATSIGVRAGPVLAGTLAVLALLPFARDRWLFVLMLGALPLYTLGGVLATPDAPMLAAWMIGLAGALRGDWRVAGVGAGLAGLSKYTGWGLWPLILMGALAPGGGEPWAARLARARALLPGLVLTLGVMAPNLLWNAQHDWISVKFQLGHGLGGEGATSREAPGMLGALALVGAQVGLVSPVLFGAFLAFWARGWKGDAVDRLCWWTSLPVLVFFSFAATLARAEPNWVAPAWIGAAVGVARAGGRVARAGWVGAGLAAVLSGLVIVHLYKPIVNLPKDPTARLGVGAVLAESVEAWGIEPVYTERYQEAALIRYYEGLETYALPGTGRLDQYDIWPTRWADRALFVRRWRGGDGMPSDRFCADRGEREVATERDEAGASIERWQVAVVTGCGPERGAGEPVEGGGP
jgi:4-amino-4-deoxy-L-arabinose transferase-like glycosyltransferase